MTSKMTSQERVLTVLKLEEPDRIPTFEWDIAPDFISHMTDGGSYEDFIEQFDLDAVMCGPDYIKKPLDNGYLLDEWGVTRTKGHEAYAMAVDEFAPIKTMADLEKWKPPDPYAPHRFETMKRRVKRFKGKQAIFVQLRDVWSNPRDLLGYAELFVKCKTEPELVAGLVEKWIKYPHFRRWVKAIHDCGLYYWKHTDGSIMTVLGSLVEAGIDGIDPIDPLAKMDLTTVKEGWGDRVAIKGNVDCAFLLVDGPKEAVIEATKECIRIAGPGGGYACSTSNSIHSGVKPDLYLAMLETIREYGVYPLDMDKLAPKKGN
jgi:uroporphyrinogen decarboxylase